MILVCLFGSTIFCFFVVHFLIGLSAMSFWIPFLNRSWADLGSILEGFLIEFWNDMFGLFRKLKMSKTLKNPCVFNDFIPFWTWKNERKMQIFEIFLRFSFHARFGSRFWINFGRFGSRFWNNFGAKNRFEKHLNFYMVWDLTFFQFLRGRSVLIDEQLTETGCWGGVGEG